jgi:hypothetical protein
MGCRKEVSRLALGRGQDGKELSCCGKSSQKVSWDETLILSHDGNLDNNSLDHYSLKP